MINPSCCLFSLHRGEGRGRERKGREGRGGEVSSLDSFPQLLHPVVGRAEPGPMGGRGTDRVKAKEWTERVLQEHSHRDLAGTPAPSLPPALHNTDSNNI